jgi:AcrR family transcriptional regulator
MKTAKDEKKRNLVAQRQRQILDAALGVFSKKGYAEATTAEIARSAGIAEGTIYNYYGSKRHLLLALINDTVESEKLVGSLERAAASGDFTHMGAIIQERLKIGFQFSARLLVLLGEVYHDGALREQYFEQVAQPILSKLEAYLKSGISQRAYRQMDTRLASRALVAMIIGLSIMHTLEGEAGLLHEMPRGQISNGLTAILLEGLLEK